jgi:putative tricarboxylic transport membrane protein
VSAGTQARLGGTAAVVIGLLAAWGAQGLGVGSLTDPGPGLWPLIVSGVLVVTGTAVALRPGEGAEPMGRESWVVVLACASLVVYTLVIPVVGFELPTAVLLAFWLRVLGREGWRTTLIVAVGGTAVVYAVFILGLGVALPHLA